MFVPMMRMVVNLYLCLLILPPITTPTYWAKLKQHGMSWNCMLAQNQRGLA